MAGRGEEEVGDGAGAETSGVDECGGCEGGFFSCGVVAGCDCVAGYSRGGADGGDGRYGGVVGDVTAVFEEGPEEILHVAVGVDDSCCRGLEYAYCGSYERLYLCCLVQRDKVSRDANRLCEFVEFHQFLKNI